MVDVPPVREEKVWIRREKNERKYNTISCRNRIQSTLHYKQRSRKSLKTQLDNVDWSFLDPISGVRLEREFHEV